MKHRSLLLVLTLLIAILALSGIWFFLTLREGPAPSPSLSSLPLKIHKLSLGHDHTATSPHHQAALKFAELVDARSKGLVKVEIFPNQQLGTGHQMLEQVREGTLAMALLPASRLTGIAPSMQYIDLPFLFPAREDAYAMMGGEPGKKLLAQLEAHDLIGCAFWDSGFKQFTANRPIRQPADFKGLKVRIMKSEIIREQFESMGAQAIPIDFHQLYQSLKDGVIDAQENPLIGIAEMKIHEVQSHLIISNHAYLAYVFLCSKQVVDALPGDIRELIVSTAGELTLYERQLLQEKEEDYLETIKKAGVTVYSLSESERMAFQKATTHLREKYREVIGRELIDRTEELLTLKYGAGEDVVIGLDADLSLGAAQFGMAIKRGLELAVAEINSEGGVLRRKIRIVTFDHGGVASRGKANMAQLAKIPNLVAVMGGLHSPVALAELDIIHENKILYLSPWANATTVVENGFQPNYVFRVSPSDRYAGKFLVEEALKISDRVALLLENTGWGRSNQEVMTHALADRNQTPAALEWMNYQEKDLSGQLAKIKDSNAQVLILAVNPAASIVAVRNLAAHGITIPIVSHWGVSGGSFWQELHQELNNTMNVSFLQSFSFAHSHNNKASSLARRYLQEYGIDRPENIPVAAATAQAYDLVHLLILAIRKAGSIERPAIRDSMERLESYQGVVKEYRPPFTPERHDAIAAEDLFMARYNAQGHIVPVASK